MEGLLGANREAAAVGSSSTLQGYVHKAEILYQRFMDRLAPHAFGRWMFTLGCIFCYILRLYFVGGYHIVSYALGIYTLNLLLGFITPKIDPEEELLQEEEEEETSLPTRKDDEFRPFVRRLPEFKFWQSLTKAMLLSISATFIGFLDIPVFWPILLIYFCVLFFVTMRKQIRHMVKHKYIPFNIGKPKYNAQKPRAS